MQERVFFGGSYRYGFNGHEKEIELNNESTSAYFWFYESALGRRLNLDPKPIVAISPYACFVNNAILFIDLLGDEIGMNNMTEKAKTTLKENWSKNTGLTLKIKDDGSLDYEKDSKGRPLVSKELKSSKIARRMLINSINSKTKVEFYDRSDQPSAQQFDGNRNHINLNIEEIESVQSSCSPNMTKESWSVGMVAFHELYHWKTDKDDPESGDNYSRGPIVKKMNRIEKELGLDQRFNYSYFNKQRIFNSTNTTECPDKIIETLIIFFDQRSLDAVKKGGSLPADGKFILIKNEYVPKCMK